jgi:hypothetical protein
MKISSFSLSFAAPLLFSAACLSQTVNTSQQILLEGLRSTGGAGSFPAAGYAADGSLFLLYDQHDGIRILKSDASGATVLAQAQLGAAGDAPLAMAVDPAGNVYVTGTTTSGALHGSSTAAFPAAADTSTNSFLAKYDANLKLVFVTFLGAGRTAAASVSATADAVFITGTTYNGAFPVTSSGLQQTPATASSANGFVERFSVDGTTLVYATYLTGAGGDTMPSAIVADAADRAYIAGATSASGYPTTSALQARILGATSGFLSSLSAAGSFFNYSTFIAGTGLNSLALDSANSMLLLTGNVSLGQFPVATVLAPLASTTYQTLLRIPVDGQSVASSVLLVPGDQSHVALGANGSAWVSGSVSTPLFPGETAPDDNVGDSFLLRVTAANGIDQTLRFGGEAVDHQSHAALMTVVSAPAVSATGTTVLVPGTVTATVDASLLATQRFDFPLVAMPNGVLPNSLRDLVSIACTNSSQCSGAAGLLAMLSTAAIAPALSLSIDDLPNAMVRNLSSAEAEGVAIVASGYTSTNDCGTMLAPSTQCSIALTGTGPGMLTVSAGNGSTAGVKLGANAIAPDALVLSASELDYGIVTSVDGVVARTITVTNLGSSAQSFTAALDGGATTAYRFANTASTCALGSIAGSYLLAAGSACQLTIGLTASAVPANDGPVHAAWKIGPRDVVLTGFAQALALHVSSAEIDFGTQFSGSTGLRLPRYLYLSNNSATAVQHTATGLSNSAPFVLIDNCPSTLEPHSVCQLAISYLSDLATSYDAITLTLDDGLIVLITGETIPPASIAGSTANPNLSVSATQLSFATPVAVTGVSGIMQTLTVHNAGTAAFALAQAITGDFTVVSGCPALLAAGASCSMLIGFTPSQPGSRDGLLSLTAGSGFAPSYVTLSGTGSAILPANNGLLSIGVTYLGEPVVAWYKVSQSLTSLTVVSNSAQFGVALVAETGNGHGTLPAADFAQSTTAACGNCWLGVQFLSETAGSASAQLTLSSAAGGSPYVLALQATALPVQGVLLSPLSPDFGSVPVHSVSAPMTFTLANLLASSSSVTVQSIAVTGDFALTTNGTGGASCVGELAATASCFVQIAFAPTATGNRSGTLTLVTSGGTVTASMVGDGVADPGIAISPTALTFSNLPGNAATQQTIQVMNTSAVNLAIGSPAASDPSFMVTSACTLLIPGGACNITVGFIPQLATTTGTLFIPVSSTVNGQLLSSTYTVPLSGAYTTQGAGLEIVSNVVNFGSSVPDTLGLTRAFTLNNLSGKTLNISFDVPRNFPLSSATPCVTLAAGASCSFGVSFLPAIGGPLTGSLTATGTPADGSATVQTLAYMLGYGSAAGTLSVSGFSIPFSPVGFGQVTSGQSVEQTLTLSNSGTGALTIHRLTTAPPFYATSHCGAALAAGGSCLVSLTYAPLDEVSASQSTAPRDDSGVLVIESDAESSPGMVSLTGIALPVVSGSAVNGAMNGATLNAYSLSTSALTFANTQVGSASAAQSIVLLNLGTTTLHLMSVTTPADFTAVTACATLLPGASCSIAVTFAPTNPVATTTRSGTLELLTDASDALEYVTLVATSVASPLTLVPSALDFGTVNVGRSDSLSLLVSNTTTAAITLSAASATGDYNAALGTCAANGGMLAAGTNCSLTVTFSPTATGTRPGTLSLADSATPLPLTAALTGLGAAGHLQITPGALSFGGIDIGASANLTLTLLNTGTAAIAGILNTVGGPNGPAFQVVVPCSVVSLAPNQGCMETVSFTPQSVGGASGTLTIGSSDPSGAAAVALSGTGIAARGSFALTVNGASSAAMAVRSGSPAVFPLTLTPLNGFTGPVALTCAAITGGPYATCSLDASTLNLNGSTAASNATLETISSQARTGLLGAAALLLGLVFLPGRRRRRISILSVLCVSGVCLFAGGCGSGISPTKLLYTPTGTYQYRVTASSTTGISLTSSVTLNLTVQ